MTLELGIQRNHFDWSGNYLTIKIQVSGRTCISDCKIQNICVTHNSLVFDS